MHKSLCLSLLLSFTLAGQCKATGNGAGIPLPSIGSSTVTSPVETIVPIIPAVPGRYVPPKVVNLRPNDVVVFAGDSVTFLGGLQGGWIEQFKNYVQMRNSGQNISVIASGVGGNTAALLDARLESTVLNYNPTVVVIFIGINDTAQMPFNFDGTSDLTSYMTTLQDIVKKCQLHAGVRQVILMTPMAYGDLFDGQGPRDGKIDAMAQALRGYAYLNNLGLIDLRRVVINAEPIFNPTDKSFGVLMDQSKVHPTALGSQILTGTALMGFGQ